MNKALKIILILAAVYVAIVVIFESLLGYYQPTNDGTLVISTFEADGEKHDRVLARLTVDDTLYVAVNHWPRAWYWRLQDNPEVEITFEGTTTPYLAVPLDGDSAEYAKVDGEHSLPTFFRILTGFPPRRLMRLDPRA